MLHKQSTCCSNSSLSAGWSHLLSAALSEALRAIIGKREVWRSLGTDSPTVALRRSYDVAAAIERDFEEARFGAGLSVDQRILARSSRTALASAKTSLPESVSVAPPDPAPGVTLRELYDAYRSGPTRDWSR